MVTLSRNLIYGLVAVAVGVALLFYLLRGSYISPEKNMMPFHGNIEKLTVENENYRKVLYTTATMQLVLMTLKPGVEIGLELHPHTTQFFRIENGQGMAIVNGKNYTLKNADALIVPPGAQHNIINTHPYEPLQIYTLYAPPKHSPGTVEKDKPETS